MKGLKEYNNPFRLTIAGSKSTLACGLRCRSWPGMLTTTPWRLSHYW